MLNLVMPLIKNWEPYITIGDIAGNKKKMKDKISRGIKIFFLNYMDPFLNMMTYSNLKYIVSHNA